MYLYHENIGDFFFIFRSTRNLEGHVVQECLESLWFGSSILGVYMTLQAQRSLKEFICRIEKDLCVKAGWCIYAAGKI